MIVFYVSVTQPDEISQEVQIDKADTMISYEYKIHPNKTNLQGAVCEEGWGLPLPYTSKDEEKLYEILKEHEITKVWLPVIRKETRDFLWLNNNKFGK